MMTADSISDFPAQYDHGINKTLFDYLVTSRYRSKKHLVKVINKTPKLLTAYKKAFGNHKLNELFLYRFLRGEHKVKLDQQDKLKFFSTVLFPDVTVNQMFSTEIYDGPVVNKIRRCIYCGVLDTGLAPRTKIEHRRFFHMECYNTVNRMEYDARIRPNTKKAGVVRTTPRTKLLKSLAEV